MNTSIGPMMKKIILCSCLVLSLTIPSYCQENTPPTVTSEAVPTLTSDPSSANNTATTNNTPTVNVANESATNTEKNTSVGNNYALDYEQFGLETSNYDEKEIFNKINKKATQVIEKEAAVVKYIAIFMGLVGAAFILFGVFSRGFKVAIVGVISICIDLVVYAIVSKWSLIYEAFSAYFWN